MPKRFSKRYKTFSDWKKGRKLTKYSRKIIENHAVFPKSTLKHLRRGISDFSTSKWNTLNPSQKRLRIDALTALSEMRKGKHLPKIIQQFDFSLKEIKEHLGKTIQFQNGNWIARKRDSIERTMIISENGKQKAILLNNSLTASKIGKYHSLVKEFLQNQVSRELKKFNPTIKDSKGKVHQLETRPNILLEIEEAKEQPEMSEIYAEEDQYG